MYIPRRHSKVATGTDERGAMTEGHHAGDAVCCLLTLLFVSTGPLHHFEVIGNAYNA